MRSRYELCSDPFTRNDATALAKPENLRSREISETRKSDLSRQAIDAHDVFAFYFDLTFAFKLVALTDAAISRFVDHDGAICRFTNQAERDVHRIAPHIVHNAFGTDHAGDDRTGRNCDVKLQSMAMQIRISAYLSVSSSNRENTESRNDTTCFGVSSSARCVKPTTPATITGTSPKPSAIVPALRFRR